MEKVKVFYVCNNSNELDKMINKWIDTEKPEITRVLQCATGRLDHHVTTTIFYKETGNVTL